MSWRRWRSAPLAVFSVALASCAGFASSLPPPTSALQAGVFVGPAVATLSLAEDDAATALTSFIESCPKLLTREDQSGLAQPSDWKAACDAATDWPYGQSLGFFSTHFTPVRVSDGSAFATGYFEPEIMGCRERTPKCEVPVYAMPDDLARAWPADVPETEQIGRPPLGRFNDAGEFVPYYSREEIAAGALADRELELAWVADPIEFFFLQIQGSGRLRTTDGEVIRIGYAGQNGREYIAIGRPMRERGLIGEGTDYPLSMQGIVAWLRDHPDQADEIMNLNKSWIFFRELEGDGPLGALEVPVRRESSIAADPRFVPLGAPVWLDLERDEADGLWIAQDTGGAIKGANRFDTFWGAGDDAREIAGSMSASGNALILLPKAAAGRLGVESE